MTPPLWGAHPHFAQFGLDCLFAEMIARCGEAIDIVEVALHRADAPAFHPCREPDLAPPATTPPGMVWLPDIRRRRALVTMDEADPDHRLRAAITSLVRAMPYHGGGDAWPCGTPELELSRHGASLRMPYSRGSVVIHAEGREKALAPDAPFWMAFVTVYHERRRPAASDVLAAGGMEGYVLSSLLDDEHLRTPTGVEPLARRPVNVHMMSLDLPLDTYLARPETMQ